MYNRFEFTRDIFLKHYSDIFKRINFLKTTTYKLYFHIIIDGITLDELDMVSKDPDFNSEILLYNRYDSTSYDSIAYITELKDSEDITLVEKMYYQNVRGFSAKDPLSNQILLVDENFNCTFKNVHGNESLGSFMDGFVHTARENVFIGKHGRCSKCLICLCDHSRVRPNMKFMVIDEECEKNYSIYKTIKDEVKEVRREEYIAMIELMREIQKTNEFTNAVVLSEINDARTRGDEK